MSSNPIVLETEELRAVVTPDGGRLLAFQARRGDTWVDIFQDFKATPTAGSAYFLMYPYTAREENGILRYEGGDFQLEKYNHPHAIHGFGRKMLWKVGNVSPNAVTLTLGASENNARYPGDLFAQLTYTLDGNELAVTVEVCNRGTEVTYLTGGSHPFILRSVAGSSTPPIITCKVGKMFEVKGMPDNPIPTGNLMPVPADIDYSSGRPLVDGYDCSFNGWDGIINVDWKDVGISLTGRDVSAVPSEFLHLWSTGADRFAFEQELGPANASKLHEQGVPCGLRVLNPNDILAFRHTFELNV